MGDTLRGIRGGGSGAGQHPNSSSLTVPNVSHPPPFAPLLAGEVLFALVVSLGISLVWDTTRRFDRKGGSSLHRAGLDSPQSTGLGGVPPYQEEVPSEAPPPLPPSLSPVGVGVGVGVGENPVPI